MKVLQKNPLKELLNLGQSVWLDYIRRSLMTSGELKRFIDEDGLRGMTSNPSIFEKAIAGSTDYAKTIEKIKKDGNYSVQDAYEELTIADIQDAADILKPVYEQTKARDGYVSMEVSPLLAYDTKGTIAEAKHLWQKINRKNVMIKVPGTEEGLPAIKQLISEGINVNVTLLFSQATYERVAEAFISGLEAYAKSGGDVSTVASVASFFISRIDSAVDHLLQEQLQTIKDAKQQAGVQALMGKTAIANGKLTYQRYQEIYATTRWKTLADKGAMTQRLLWASTSTKNPSYPDTLYVDELIGPDTVNTIPPATFDAYRDHGKPSLTLTEDVKAAHEVMRQLQGLKISLDDVTSKLVTEGVDIFADSFKKLLDTIEKQIKTTPAKVIDRLNYDLPADLKKSVEANIKDWQDNHKTAKLWERNASLWTGTDESKWLDWLHVTDDQIAHIDDLKKLASEIKSAGYTHALLLGMGGSSLCPEVLSMTFGKAEGFPQLLVLDSTDPQEVQTRLKQIDPAKTVFIVSSKSGSTLEPNIFKQFFWQEAAKAVGADKVGSRFIAITDPGSHMQKVAEQDKFGHIFYGLPGIGGRYSALSDFGIVPAAIMGIDVAKFLDITEEMVQACAASVAASENPGVILGAILGTAAKSGRDKVTLIASPGISDLGAWLEQLLAESTGKQGHGIIPVDREKLGAPDLYGADRVFVYLRLDNGVDRNQDQAVEALVKKGQPVVTISIPDIYHLGQEFFRWEIATAVAGSIIGINAFNQPDVEASKIETRKLTDEYEAKGALPGETPFFEEGGIKLFSDKKNADALNKAVGNDKSLTAYLKAHFNRLQKGDYAALLAYIEMDKDNEKILQEARLSIRDKKSNATCLGFGPRFLHSTGQAYKGGPNSGVFLQITADDAKDLPVPGQKYSFGIVKQAQARGDFQVLLDRDRRALRVHLSKNVGQDLTKLKEAIKKTLA